MTDTPGFQASRSKAKESEKRDQQIEHFPAELEAKLAILQRFAELVAGLTIPTNH